ncbi:aldolase [Fomitiporia mediterranea MF3/22]|uniref:aldolase n=1 Tax=Fomitiporia mediterranea (strain MF3/22) TaxID=694068 RepID=UPI0004408723|nr:aldolase [Fomitiporia mediterranea MF3/22]EJD02005.1 aldolase [Fomitiporia mediterranea MF3/22]
MNALRRRIGSLLAARRSLATTSRNPNFVNIVEVGPRDGLQNEKAVIPPAVKVELINRLGRAGLKSIESGSFVSPKWVPQMAGTADVLSQMERLPGVHYPVLVPNTRGLDDLLRLLASPSKPDTLPRVNEIAVFSAATDAFSRANTNCTVKESLERLAPVVERAAAAGLRVRGYVSVVITCPYSGRADYKRVRDVSRALLDMGCYEVSLGDTTGTGTPASVLDMLSVVSSTIPVRNLAGHFHDTFGTAVANIFAALSAGIRTFDSSVAGLGGCPYSPGATGNVATEDVLHALRDSGYEVAGDLRYLVDTGFWISEQLGRENCSRAGRAFRAAELRQQSVQKERTT